MKPYLFCFIFLCCMVTISYAQKKIQQQNDTTNSLNNTDDLSGLLQQLDGTKKNALVNYTFKATQIINTPTIETPGKRGLQVMIQHRFGRINQGIYEFFGLDNATIRLSADYGILDNLSVGIGRQSYDKVYDANIKYNFLRQKEHGMPVTVGVYSQWIVNTTKYVGKPYLDFINRTSYGSQLMIARKFSNRLSLQLTPAWTHYNIVPTNQDLNDIFTVGLGGRFKITNRFSINAEYNYLPPNQVVSTKVYSSFSVGLDLETGGHIFQFIFTNSQGMDLPYYLTKTAGSWLNGDIYFGFNLIRNFTIPKYKKKLKHIPPTQTGVAI